jgi:uncharacterized membrane protein YtjA (UPF0391 family)
MAAQRTKRQRLAAASKPSGNARGEPSLTGFGSSTGAKRMLWTIVVILVILWLLGFSLHIGAGLIHILLVIALIVGLVQLFTGRRV